jgi:signal transduction histidine kinase
VSTQHAVTQSATATQALGWAFAAWQAAVVLAGLAAWVAGANLDAVAGASALALAPGLAGLALLPRLGEKLARTILLTVWLSAPGALIAGAGGAASPMAACLAIAPALCAALGWRRAPEAGAAALFVYAVAVLTAAFVAPAHGLGVFPHLLTAIALAFASAMIALRVSTVKAPERPFVLAELAHELRTPLTHVIGFADMLRHEVAGPIGEANRDYARLIHQSGAHMLDVTDEILDAARIDSGKRTLRREIFDARELVQEASAQCAQAAGTKKIVLSTAVPDDALLVNADKTALRRILLNLVGNALKFTPEGGRVRIEARARDGRFELDVADSGPGIAAEERARLGRPFARGEGAAAVEGTGLGLSLVRALIGLHDGALSFHDAEGGGALVRASAPILA